MVDVCLVVEGSYPYVTGGVSAWADGLLSGLPDVSFTVAHLRDEHDPEEVPVYTRPANATLVHIDLDPEEVSPEPGLHRNLPEARVYHAACTGAAGELARLAAAERGAGFALTEHGLAWREARLALEGTRFQPTGWCRKWRTSQPTGWCRKWRAPQRGMSVREVDEVANEVLAMAMAAYADAGAVTSVCGPNALAQHRLGAAADRLRVIPNPVGAGPERTPGDGFLVGFVGRVVAVKDVEMFLQACALVAERRSDARFAVVGPLDHEPEYAQACIDLAGALGIAERVEFTGETDPRPWLARMDALTLTSISEAQPLVALEAMAAGVPVVATDVGGCREAIGNAGLLTRPGDARATADALLRLAHDELLRARLGAAGRHRAATAHDPQRVYGAYREMYERLAA
jgi:glycosyltransferase involved in cell wall biosynthesis